jgi:cell division protein FtsZ
MNDTSPRPEAASSATPAAPMPEPVHMPAVRVVGIGSAAANALSHISRTDLRDLDLFALHTNARVLDNLDLPRKKLFGVNLTHGLGSGGDPSLGRAAAEAEADSLAELFTENQLVFILLGLGGGTGTGAAPVLARLAKERGALALGVATLPFEFECLRRQRLAQQGLEELKAAADSVICLPNQKIFRLVDENTSVLESLKITNELLAQGMRGIWQMLSRPSLIHVDFADLRAVLRGRHAECTFATAYANGEGRAREIIEKIVANPLLDGGQALPDAGALLVNLVGGPDLTIAEVKRIMEELKRRASDAQIVMGAGVASDMKGRLELTLVASRRSSPEQPQAPCSASDFQTPSRQISVSDPNIENSFLNVKPAESTRSRLVPPPPELTPEQTERIQRQQPSRSGAKGRSSLRLRQGQLPLEIVSKGRFERSQPTIHRGEDLDMPTYLRRGIPLN